MSLQQIRKFKWKIKYWTAFLPSVSDPYPLANLHGYPNQKKTSAPATAALFVSPVSGQFWRGRQARPRGREAHLSSLAAKWAGHWIGPHCGDMKRTARVLDPMRATYFQLYQAHSTLRI
jgi:hypothetical protein